MVRPQLAEQEDETERETNQMQGIQEEPGRVPAERLLVHLEGPVRPGGERREGRNERRHQHGRVARQRVAVEVGVRQEAREPQRGDKHGNLPPEKDESPGVYKVDDVPPGGPRHRAVGLPELQRPVLRAVHPKVVSRGFLHEQRQHREVVAGGGVLVLEVLNLLVVEALGGVRPGGLLGSDRSAVRVHDRQRRRGGCHLDHRLLSLGLLLRLRVRLFLGKRRLLRALQRSLAQLGVPQSLRLLVVRSLLGVERSLRAVLLVLSGGGCGRELSLEPANLGSLILDLFEQFWVW